MFLYRTRSRELSDWRLEADKEPDIDLWNHGDCQWLLNREIVFSNSFEGEIFLFHHCFGGNWEMLITTERRERDRWRDWLSVFLWNEETVYYWFTKVKFVVAEWMHLFKTRGKNRDQSEKVESQEGESLSLRIRRGAEMERRERTPV